MRIRHCSGFVLAIAGSAACASVRSTAQSEPSRVHVTFRPEGATFEPATREYQHIWESEGAKIVETMERISGIRFDSPPYADTAIAALVFEGVSNSGFREQPMRLRASYESATKRATLVHELGHRLQVGVARDEDEHAVLFLWLYDTWTALWGKAFADEQVLVERARRGPYPAAWDSALRLTPAERAARWKDLRDRHVIQQNGHPWARTARFSLFVLRLEARGSAPTCWIM